MKNPLTELTCLDGYVDSDEAITITLDAVYIYEVKV